MSGSKDNRRKAWAAKLAGRRQIIFLIVAMVLLGCLVALGYTFLYSKRSESNQNSQTEANSNERQVSLNQEEVKKADTTEKKIEALLGLAADYSLVNDQEGSISAYEQVLQLDSNNETALGSLAYIYYQRKDSQNAEKYLVRVIDIIGKPADPRAQDNLDMYQTMLVNVRNGSFGPIESSEAA